MNLRILYVEETAGTVAIAGRDVRRLSMLTMRTWEDQRRTGWPPSHQLYDFAAKIARKDWNHEEWECVAMVPIMDMGPASLAYLWGLAGDRVNEIDVVIKMRRRPMGPRAEGA